MPDEDCDFLQMTEVPPASSVGERSPRRESTFSISPPSPTRRRRVTSQQKRQAWTDMEAFASPVAWHA